MSWCYVNEVRDLALRHCPAKTSLVLLSIVHLGNLWSFSGIDDSKLSDSLRSPQMSAASSAYIQPGHTAGDTHTYSRAGHTAGRIQPGTHTHTYSRVQPGTYIQVKPGTHTGTAGDTHTGDILQPGTHIAGGWQRTIGVTGNAINLRVIEAVIPPHTIAAALIEVVGRTAPR